MSQPTVQYSVRWSAILLPNFPGFKWGGALLSWKCILLYLLAQDFQKDVVKNHILLHFLILQIVSLVGPSEKYFIQHEKLA
jgi:hypothetical protein